MPLKNKAFVFIKPHAVTEATKDLVKNTLESKGITILTEGSIASEKIDEELLIDQHYYAIASKATILKPKELNVPVDKFKAKFGLEWEDALAKGLVFNAMDACEELGLDSMGLDVEWAKSKDADKLVKFGGGFYCGLVDSVAGKEPIYVFNGFFMAMRNKFTAPGLAIHYYVVEWDAATLPWADFRGKVLGPTDPASAPAESIRGMIMSDWKELGLKTEPTTGDNGVHASASPLEGLGERANWLKMPLEKDDFATALVAAGVSLETIRLWSVDPVVPYGDGAKGSVFDKLEDLDADECVAAAVLLLAAAEPAATE